ncbi:MAG: carbamoyltransferase C-terminal domain-containing protein [Candidatus Methanoperedens sp.]
MLILGISTSHDGTLSIVKDGINIFSIGEERLNRIKSYIGFPFESLRFVLKNGLIKPGEIDLAVVSTSKYHKEVAEAIAFLLTEDKKYYDVQNDKKPDDYYINDSEWKKIKTDAESCKYAEKKIKILLAENGINAPVIFLDHHLSHAASAYYSSGKKMALAFTMDGEGDFLSATVNICRNGKIELISETDHYNSAGYLYSAVTKKCGFKVSRHEGKITGLAAYGDPTKAEKCFDKQLKIVDGRLEFVKLTIPSLKHRAFRKFAGFFGFDYVYGYDELIERCGNLSNEDLAASVQHLLEKRICEIVTYWIEKTGIRDVVLAGGVFANVKFNQKISELECVDSVYIYPDMGDGGAAYGAAIYKYHEKNNYDPEKMGIKTIYYGPEYSDQGIEIALKKHPKINYKKSSDVCKETAMLVADNKIVGWFQGRMEYGPRALGNRSILANPTDRDINKWLNDRLKRTEFMPFAPSCLYEYADDVFDIPKESMKFPALFMTITFNMKDEWVKKAPAVAHIDKTARPQLVTKESNPKYHKLLQEYYEITGLPLFINTSFNVHEEPIVCKPEDAIKSLLTGVIDYLVIGDYICKLG